MNPRTTPPPHPSTRTRRRPRRSTLAPILATSVVLAVGAPPVDASISTSSQVPVAASLGSVATAGSSSVLRQASPSGGGNLDVAPDWNAPGIRQGRQLIGWAKAGAIIFGVLGLMGGVVIGKVLKESGNHHASGVRMTAMGVGGALVLAGAAPEIVPWLMG